MFSPFRLGASPIFSQPRRVAPFSDSPNVQHSDEILVATAATTGSDGRSCLDGSAAGRCVATSPQLAAADGDPDDPRWVRGR
jgi:hypothetical protein